MPGDDRKIEAVLFDFGGVLSTSPFEAFARYEREHGLPDGFIRRLNAADPDTNAWAQLERGHVDLDGFASLYRAEAQAAGHDLDGLAVLELLRGDLRPEMVEAVRRCKTHYGTALLTNNFTGLEGAGAMEPALAEVLSLFDVVVESSQAGVRKPDPAFYRLACDQLGIDPSHAVFLDDLGVNLKPAAALGMTTIKVTSADQALADLEAVLALPLR